MRGYAKGNGACDLVVGRSLKEMNEKVSNLLVEDTEEMMGWRSISQEEIDEHWERITQKNWERSAEKIKDGGQ